MGIGTGSRNLTPSSLRWLLVELGFVLLVAVLSMTAVAAPYLVKDISEGITVNPGPHLIWFLPGTQSGFFTADTPGYGEALWITDGTESGTRLVKDIVPGLGPTMVSGSYSNSRSSTRERYRTYSASPPSLSLRPPALEVGGMAYLGVQGRLWRSDGTTAGTVPLLRVDVLAMAEFQEELWFVGYRPDANFCLFRTDGTAEGTRTVVIFPPGADYARLLATERTMWILTGPYRWAGSSMSQANSYRSEGFFANVWRTDGTAEGTALVPLIPGTFGATLLGEDLVCFPPNHEAGGYDLWRTNGTAAGTQVLVSAVQTGGFRYVWETAEVGNALFFFAADRDDCAALWKTDGTPEGTVRLLPTTTIPAATPTPTPTPTPTSTYPPPYPPGDSYSGEGYNPCTDPHYQIVTAGSVAVFTYNDSVHGEEVWVSDGTPEGTRLLVDARPGLVSSYPYSLSGAGDHAFFGSYFGTTGNELWTTDGTPEGTYRVRAFDWPMAILMDYASGPPFAFLYGAVFFQVNDQAQENGLWRSDGTVEGTRLVKALIPANNGFSAPDSLLELNDTVVFEATTPEEGRELWRTEGTSEETQLVREIIPGYSSYSALDWSSFVMRWNNLLLFDTGAPGNSRHLWRTDGTEAGTMALIDLPNFPYLGGARVDFWPPEPSSGSMVLFAFHDHITTSTTDTSGEVTWHTLSADGLYRTDGTPQGTYLLKTGWTSLLGHVGSETLFWFDPIYYDRQTTNTILDPPPSIWKTDGTVEGTSWVADLPSGDLTPYELGSIPGVLLLHFSDYFSGLVPIWRTDGTPDGTYPLLEETWDPRTLGVFQDHALFWTETSFEEGTLWSSDGTIDGTIALAVETPGTPSAIGELNGRFLFELSSYSGPSALWSTDGTPEGTEEFKELPPRNYYSYGGVVLGTLNGLFLIYRDSSESSVYPINPPKLGLWTTDGTTEGTFLLRSLEIAGYSRSGLSQLDYSSTTGESPVETSPYPGFFRGTVLSGNCFVFFADDGVHGREPWVSDGTIEGTRLLRDILPGDGISAITPLAFDDNHLFFTADDGVTGNEIWVTDGTPAGTVRATDLIPGPEGIGPQEAAIHQGNVFFPADDGSGIGTELWALPLAELPMPTQLERDILARILGIPDTPAVDDQNADGTIDMADFVTVRK